LFDELRLIRRQLRESVKVELVAGGVGADRLGDELAVLNRMLDQLAGGVIILPVSS
jgi:hypothetical protein